MLKKGLNNTSRMAVLGLSHEHLKEIDWNENLSQ